MSTPVRTPSVDIPDTAAAPVTIAVIGAGTIARAVHLPLLSRSPFFDLRAVSDLDDARAGDLAHRHGAEVNDIARILADPAIEAVLVSTPGNHAQIASNALQAGKHVLAEKPLALTVAEAEQVGALAARVDRVLQVGSMKMYDALVPVARQTVRELAELRLVEVSVRHPADAPQLQHLRLQPPAPLSPAAAEVVRAADAYDSERVLDAVGDVPPPWQRLYRSVLCGSVLHEVSLLRAVGITLPERFDHADLYPWPVDGPPSITAIATLSAASRLVLSWNWLPDYPEYGEVLSVVSTGGALRLDVAPPYVLDARSSLSVVRGVGGVGGASSVGGAGGVGEAARSGGTFRPVVGHDGAFQRQLEAFAHSIRDRRPVLADAAGAAADVRCLQALMRALAAGRGITLGGEAGRAA